MKLRRNIVVLVCVGLLVGGCGLMDEFTVPAPDSLTGEACFLTPSDMEGPYYMPDAPFKEALYPEGTPGQRVIVSGTVYSAGCAGVYADAVVDVWQADASGVYDFSDQFVGRARIRTDANGRYTFETVLPGEYEPRPPHIHFKFSHPNAVAITTQLYFQGSVSGAPEALVIPLEQDGDRLRGTFDIVLGP